MNNSLVSSLISFVSVAGILSGVIFLLYAMLKNDIRLIKNALSINLLTTVFIFVLYIINKKLLALPGLKHSAEYSLLHFTTLGMFSLLGFFALIGIAYYFRSKYMPLVIIKSSFALSTLIVVMMFGVAISTSKSKPVSYSSQSKFVEVDSYSSFNTK